MAGFPFPPKGGQTTANNAPVGNAGQGPAQSSPFGGGPSANKKQVPEGKAAAIARRMKKNKQKGKK